MEDVTPTWNKGRIFVAVFLLILLLVGGYFFRNQFLSDNQSIPTKSVAGVASEGSDQAKLNLDIQGSIKEKINNLKDEVSGLDFKEIASSSPQVQKIINDIKSFEQYPKDQLREICKKICNF